MTIGSIEARSQQTVQSLLNMRRQLDELQMQIGTGKKAVTYAGLGVDSGLTVSLHGQLAALESYNSTMAVVGTTLGIGQTALDGLSDAATTVKHSLLAPFVDSGGGRTNAQATARGQLDHILDILNAKAGDRYLFSGRKLDTPPVETATRILEGDGGRAGLKQLIAERTAADRGASGLGRLEIPAPTGTAVDIAEDVAGSPFGLKLAGVQTTMPGATVTGPAGSPPAISVDLGAVNPAPSESLSVTFTLPDGTAQTVRLAAAASPTPNAGEFAIGSDTNATAANLQAALIAAVSGIARTTLPAASAIAAANGFFAADANNPPQRVGGLPPESATTLVAGTAANTVIWYKGEAGSDPARSSAVARIDSAITVPYGMRANENAIRALVQSTAVLAAAAMPPNPTDAAAGYAALVSRVSEGLSSDAGAGGIRQIAGDLAAAQTAIKAAGERQTQARGVVNGYLDAVEGVSTEEVAARILALQTKLQASMQTTAKLFQMSLVNYL